jgi:DNA-binding CsgD family transcriptional regulator
MALTLGRGLGASLAAVAALNAVSALSMPLGSQASGVVAVVVSTALLAAHAALYWFGDRLRERLGLGGYAVAQAIIVVAIALARPPVPVILGVFVACTAELVLVAGSRWGTTRITLVAIALFVVAAAITSTLYQAATAGLLLAVTGLVAHAVAGLVRRPLVTPAPSDVPPPRPTATESRYPTDLSAREVEVLRELVSGARNSDIARSLGITELTVKAHLRSIYQKLGVQSRAAAVAIAIQRKLV